MIDAIQLWGLLAVPESLILALSVLVLGRLIFRYRSASRCKLFTLALVAIIIAPALTIMVDHMAVVSSATPAPEAAIGTPVAESAIGAAAPKLTVALGSRDAVGGLVRVLGMIWILGMAIAGIRLLCGLRNLRRLLRSGSPCEDEAVLATVADVAQRLGLTRVPRVRIVDPAVSPFVTGIVRPTIVLPSALCAALEPAELEDVLIHEGAHILRRDLAVDFVQRALATVFWFCPWLHLLNRALTRAREEVCDNFVVTVRDATDYANTLLRVGEMIAQRPPVASAAMAVSKSSLRGRVETLLSSPCEHETKGAGLSVFAAFGVLLAGAMLVLLPLTGQAAEAVANKPETTPDAPATQVMVAAKFVEITGDAAHLLDENRAVSILTSEAAEALQKKLAELSGTDILSAPKVTTLSGQTATIKMVQQRTFAELQRPVELGVSFEVTPTVGEAGSIELEMKPEVVEFVGYADGMPIISTRTVDSQVKLRNGETVVLGGMTTEREVTVSDKIPLLGDLPLVGKLFSSPRTVSEERVLLVIVTATVLGPEGLPE